MLWRENQVVHKESLSARGRRGTLILIALIVLVFTRQGSEELQEEVEKLSEKIGELETVIVEQGGEIQKLREAVEKQAAGV